MKVRAYGKINLSLYVTGMRGNLHTLDSVMTTVSVCDELTVVPAPMIGVTCGLAIPPASNVAYRAARLVEEACGLKLAVDIKKGIPVGGGLGGSSADGAAVLYCARELSPALDVRALSARLGSDVYFMLRGGSCRVTGTGDELAPIDSSADFSALIVDCGSVGTPECYRTFDRIGTPGLNRNDELIAALRSGKKIEDGSIHNDLAAPARLLNPRIAAAEEIIRAAGSAPHLTGSGGCLFVLDAPAALADKLERQGFPCKFVSYAPRGVEIVG